MSQKKTLSRAPIHIIHRVCNISTAGAAVLNNHTFKSNIIWRKVQTNFFPLSHPFQLLSRWSWPNHPKSGPAHNICHNNSEGMKLKLTCTSLYLLWRQLRMFHCQIPPLGVKECKISLCRGWHVRSLKDINHINHISMIGGHVKHDRRLQTSPAQSKCYEITVIDAQVVK